MTEDRRIQLVAEVDSTGTRAGFAEIARQAGTMATSVTRAGQQAQQATSGIGGGANRSAAQVEAAQRNLIGSIERTTAAMQSGSRTGAAYYEVLARQRGVDPAVLRPYLDQLRAIEAQQLRSNAALAGSSQSLNRVGTSAAQTAAALRGVPAQFTDIITSIQGGQAPLTVLLQQGGQLKDMFGGAGAAAKALGGYVLGMINPFTVAAAVVGGLAAAHHVGAAEAKEYSRTLILSGNAVGATSNQLADISRTIGQVSGSQRVAAEAVTALAGTGRVSVDNLQKFGAAAVEVQKVIGRSIADTATDFASLGKTPLTALDQINEKYHFITAATYAQVKALQDQGKASEAAKVAQNAYADAVANQKDKILASLTDWERGWIRIKTATSGVIDAAIDLALGRQQTGIQKITAALAERELIEKRIAVAVSKGDAGKEAGFRKDLAANETTINGLRAKEDSTKAVAAAEAAGIKVAEAKNKWLKDGDQYLSRAAQLERDITAARNEGAAAQLSSGEIEKRVGAVRKKYADIYNDGIDSNIEALKRRAAVEDALAKRAMAQITFNRSMGDITEREGINQAAEVDLSGFDKRRAFLVAELDLLKQKQNSLKDQKAKLGEIDVLDQERLSRTIQKTQDLLLLEEKRSQASRDLFNKGISGAGSELDSLRDAVKAQGEYNEQIGLNKVQVAALQATRIDALATLKDETAAALDAFEPGSQLAAIYRDQAAALRERATGLKEGAGKEFQFDEWKKAVDTYSDVFRTGFADMLNNGKAGWKSFTTSLVTTFKTSVADQIYKMFAQPFVVKLVASLLGVTGGAATTLAQAAAGPGGASGAGGYVSLAQTAKSAYDAISSGFANIGTSVADGVQAALYQSGATTQIASNGAIAQGAGTAAGYAGGMAAGKMIGSAIAGQYQIGNHGSAITNIATITGAFFGGPIGGAIGGAIGGLLNRAFGMGSEQVKGNTLNGSFGSGGFTGATDTKIHQDGGWFRSDKDFTRSTAIDDPTAKALSSAYDQIKIASVDFATTLGLNADSIKDRAQSLSIALTDDKAANQKAIADFFVGVGDSIAKELLPTISDFSKAAAEFGGIGESASATLQRIATDYAFIDVALASINETFGAVGVGSIAARERLVDLSGGLDAFGKGVAGFAQNYLTEAERLKPVAKSVGEALAALGFVGDKALNSRDDFKAAVLGLIDGGKLATEAGEATYAGLIKVQDGFAQLHPAIEATTAALAATNKGYQDQINEILRAGMSLSEIRTLDIAGMDASTITLYDRLAALKAVTQAEQDAATALQNMKSAASGLLGGVDSAFSVVQKVVDREKSTLTKLHESQMKGIQTRIDAESAAIAKVKSLSDSLHGTLDSLKFPGQEAADRSSAQAQIKAALAIARAGGPLPESDSLKRALSTVTQDASSMFSTFQDYQRDFYSTQDDIASLADLSDKSLSAEEQALAVLNAQKDIAQTAYEQEVKRLDDIITGAQTQIEILKGMDTSLLTIAGAMTGFNSAIANANKNPIVAATASINDAYQSALGRAPEAQGLEFWQNQAAGGMSPEAIAAMIKNSPEAKVQELYHSALGRQGEASGVDFWMKALSNGVSVDAAKAAMMQSDEYKKLHPFAVGTNRVPFDMPAYIHEDERIIPAADNRALMARLADPGANNAVLVAAVERLTKTVEQQDEVLDKIARETKRQADGLEVVTDGFNAMRTTA